jgi:hypothetical protein
MFGIASRLQEKGKKSRENRMKICAASTRQNGGKIEPIAKAILINRRKTQ